MKAFQRDTLVLRTKTFLAMTLVCLLAACGNDRPFDSAAWQQGDLRTRGSMAEDLIERKVLIGRPASDVERLLGSPDKSYASALVYKIDMGMPLKDPSRYAFIVYLDGSGNVRESQITD